ncbi:MAG: MCE family protein [bacterium]|nr:MAG: MCE family protein [bacterium]
MTKDTHEDGSTGTGSTGNPPEAFRRGPLRARSLELRVGLAVFVAAVILILGIMWFQGFNVGRSTYEIHVVFPMVGGIDKGDEVNVNGVKKGEVKAVTLRSHDVRVTLEMRVSVRIPTDSRVILQTLGIMGERAVTIILGKSETFLEPGATLDGTYDPGISEALASMARLMEDLKGLTAEIHEIADVLTAGESLHSTIRNLSSITDELRGIIDEAAPEIKEGVSSFRRSADHVDDLLERNSGRLDSIIVAMDEMSDDLPELVKRISNVTTALSDIMDRMARDDNTLGSLIQDRALLDKLERAIVNLDELITDIRANPKRYLKVEVF